MEGVGSQGRDFEAALRPSAEDGRENHMTTLSRRGIKVHLPKRGVCCLCREYIMPGQAYRYANIDPKDVTITYLHSHVLCGDERAKREAGAGTGVPDEVILKFWRDMEVLEREHHHKDVA